MQSADFRNSYDSSQSLPLNRPRFRRILCQGQMSPGIQIVTEVSLENPSQMRLSEHDDVVEAFPANTSNQTLGKRILPRTPWSSVPGLGWFFASFRHQTRDCALGD